ncbi:MAG: hypothetical protein ABI629_16860 [bacterium]
MANNGDTQRVFKVGKKMVRGIGSFHKTLPHNQFGEVDQKAFLSLVAGVGATQFANPQGGWRTTS